MNAQSTIAAAAGLLLVSEAALFAAPAVDFPTQEEALKSFFPGADAITKELGLVAEPDGLKLRRGRTPRHLFRHVARKDGAVLGYAVVSEVMGKARPITYMLAVDAAGEVLGIEVLAYRESHGGEIGRAVFRRQFEGKDAASKLKLDDDIRNIAGATISCRAVTDGVADLLDVLAAIPNVAVVSASPAPAEEPVLPIASGGPFVRVQVHMNAPLSLTLPSSLAREDLLGATDAAFAEAKRLEGLFSPFLATSDVAQLNAQASGAPVAVAPETRALLVQAVTLSERTRGAFDPTAGALVKLVKAAGPAPAEAALVAARSQCGTKWLEFTEAGVRLTRRGVAVDLGASAKGATLDRLAVLLQGRGVTSGVLNFGGQVLVFGDESAAIESRDEFVSLKLQGGSLATSGDGERPVTGAHSGPRSHIVDPRTGHLVAPHAPVQVFAPTALEADALATALYVLGPDEAWSLCKELGIAARFGAGMDKPVRVTSAWAAHFGEAL